MPDTASAISAVTASLAAILTGVNLYLSGRRERNRWARDALVGAFMTVLNTSFANGRAARQLADADADGREKLLAELEEAHRQQINTITKLRLLTSPRMVEAALALHLADHGLADLVRPAHAGIDPEIVQARTDDIWRARQRFLSAAKTEIGLPPQVADTARH